MSSCSEAHHELLQRWPNIKFFTGRDGIYRERFEREATRLGLRNNLLFTGCGATGNPAYMALMDVLVHLSLREGLHGR